MSCGPPYPTDPQSYFGDTPVPTGTYQIQSHTIHYVETGKNNDSLVVFIHGTPGSWLSFGDYVTDKQLLNRFRMIAVDRPGFGKSDPGNPVLSLAKQASLLKPLLDRNKARQYTLLVGHSLGGPLAARMAMDYPEMVDGLLLIAPSLDPELESPRWYNNLAKSWIVSWLLPKELKLANEEIFALRNELSAMVPFWSRLKMPISVIQGEDDKLVDPANADFAAKVIGDSLRLLRYPEAGHFILWEQRSLVTEELLRIEADLKTKNEIHQKME